MKKIQKRENFLDWAALAKRVGRKDIRSDQAHRVLLLTVLSGLGLVTSDRFAPVETQREGECDGDAEGAMSEGFRKLGLSTGARGGRQLTTLVSEMLVMSLYGHSTANWCSNKHASFVDRFFGGPRLTELTKETLAQLGEVTDATSYLRMILTLGDVYLVHEKRKL